MTKVEVSPLVGYNSLRALNVFHTLLLGVKMLPAYGDKHYEDFYDELSKATAEKKEQVIREAALFVELSKDEIEAIIGFCKDPNGVAYGPHNIKNLNPAQIHECIVAVCLEVAKIKVNFVTDGEKKKLKTLPSISEEHSQNTPITL